MKPTAFRVVSLTLLALAGFAANSILCRLALRSGLMDPASFTSVRIVSGAAVLLLILRLKRRPIAGSWLSAAALMAYAAGFSYAYVSIPAGVGALLLFGTVQATMIGAGLLNGERPNWNEWLGEFISLAGLVALLLPGVSAPPLLGAFAMALAGIAWGVFSIRGRRGGEPLAATAGNFLRAVLFAAVLSALDRETKITSPGLIYALLSGALASGLGYAIWYAVLPALSAVRAGVVQLSVPVLVAAIGILFLGEPPTLRLLLCAALILGGLALATLYRRRRSAALAPLGQAVPQTIRPGLPRVD
jgi:drug/metabolite transporter (DMT)-like permease